MMTWLRLYIDVLDNPKINKMSDTQFRIFIYLLLMAREKNHEGSFAYHEEDIAWRLRRSKAVIRKTVNLLTELEIVVIENGILKFLNWSKRQYKSDDISGRVRAHRQTEKRNVTGNVIDQNREDTVSDTEKSR